MTLYGYPALKIEFDSAVPALTDISAYVTSINGYTIEQILEEISAAGDASDRWAAVGFEQKSEITLTGPYDNAAAGLVGLTIGVEGATRTLQITFDDPGAADVRIVETIIRSTEVAPSRGAFHGYTVTLRPTGAIT